MKVLEDIRTMVGTVAEDEEKSLYETGGVDEYESDMEDFEDAGDEYSKEPPPQPSPEESEGDKKGEEDEEVYDEMNKPNTLDVPDDSENKDIRSIEVEVEFSDAEINKLANKLNDLYGEKLALDDEKESSSKYYNGLIKSKEAEMKEVHKKILQGTETKYIPCRLEFNYETNSKEYINTMTGEVVKSEAITSETPSLFQKPLDEGEYPESEDTSEEIAQRAMDLLDKIAESNEEKDFEEACDAYDEAIGSNITVMKLVTEEAVSSTIPPWPPVN